MERKHSTIPYIIALSKAFLAITALFSFLIASSLAQEEEEGSASPCPKPYIKIISPRAAEPLQEIKIRGNRFGDEPGSVSFPPGVEGKVVTWSYKRIHVLVPEEVESGNVTVVSPCGSVSNHKYFTVNKGEGKYE